MPGIIDGKGVFQISWTLAKCLAEDPNRERREMTRAEWLEHPSCAVTADGFPALNGSRYVIVILTDRPLEGAPALPAMSCNPSDPWEPALRWHRYSTPSSTNDILSGRRNPQKITVTNWRNLPYDRRAVRGGVPCVVHDGVWQRALIIDPAPSATPCTQTELDDALNDAAQLLKDCPQSPVMRGLILQRCQIYPPDELPPSDIARWIVENYRPQRYLMPTPEQCHAIYSAANPALQNQAAPLSQTVDRARCQYGVMVNHDWNYWQRHGRPLQRMTRADFYAHPLSTHAADDRPILYTSPQFTIVEFIDDDSQTEPTPAANNGDDDAFTVEYSRSEAVSGRATFTATQHGSDTVKVTNRELREIAEECDWDEDEIRQKIMEYCDENASPDMEIDSESYRYSDEETTDYGDRNDDYGRLRTQLSDWLAENQPEEDEDEDEPAAETAAEPAHPF